MKLFLGEELDPLSSGNKETLAHGHHPNPHLGGFFCVNSVFQEKIR
tara:strand:+ start:348 stop:485 length:138 start_codon:yes stop_codon:yes gene_type:complete